MTDDWVEAEEEMSSEFWYDTPKEVRDKIRASKLGNRNRWREDLTPKYEEVKKLVADGVQVSCACEAVGITRDQYYRRRRIEMNGRDRV